MSTRELLEYLCTQGCALARHGGKHDFWRNPLNAKTATIPRHRTIPKGTVRSICKQLDVPNPLEKL